MIVIVVGLNHRTVPLDTLERMTVGSAQLPKALHDLSTREHLNEVVLLSTCHRTEIYLTADRFHGAVQDVRNFLSDLSAYPPESFSDHLYAYYDDAAAAHLFGVVSGLDSVVIGESEIVGQVRAAWDGARENATSGPTLSALFRHALEVGKRARTETAIARRITSVSQAAVAFATDRLGDLSDRRVLVLGAGEMGESMAIALSGSGVREILVANRTRAKATELARRVGGRGIPIDRLPATMVDVDVLLCSTGAPGLMLESSDVEEVMAARNGRPLLILDVAVPRDVDGSVADIEGVTLLDMDDVKGFVAEGMEERRKEVARVQAIIAEEVGRYQTRVFERDVAPTITEVRAHAESIRLAELERFRSRLDALDPRQREVVDALTKGIVAKLLHEPTVRLKESAGDESGVRLNEALRTLFGL